MEARDKAQNLDDAYRACNPDLPLSVEDERYVDLSTGRGESEQIALNIARGIRRSDEHSRAKLLFTGHRGSGKTTELFRIQHELEENRFFTIYLDVEQVLDLGSLSYLDVLVAMARRIQESLEEKGMPVSQVLLNNISEWFAEQIIEDKTLLDSEAGLHVKAGAGVKIPLFADLFTRVISNFKAASSHREIIRHNLKREISVFINKLNVLVKDARQKIKEGGFNELVIIVDGIEKMHYEQFTDGHSTYSELFVQHAEQLCAPECHIIYTVPVSLAYMQNLGADFDDVVVLPMVKMDKQGISQLCEIIEKRMEIDSIFENRALVEALAKMSGGIVRELMRLIRFSMDIDRGKVGDEQVKNAINKLKKTYDRLIRNDDIEAFRKIKETQRIQADEGFARLLGLRLVLEYQNGERWADLHPILQQISWINEALGDAESAA